MALLVVMLKLILLDISQIYCGSDTNNIANIKAGFVKIKYSFEIYIIPY
jgi:hypothetical protein